MKKKDWQRVEDAMAAIFGSAKLKADGHEITLCNVQHERKIEIKVYVDDWVRGEWLDPKKPCAEQPYMRKCEKNLYKKKEREEYAKFVKQFGKREAKKYLPDMSRKYVFFTPYFPSVRAIRLQYEKSFKAIELVTE